MKTITFSDFRKNASNFIDEVEHGEKIVILRHGKPVAEISQYSGESGEPSWRQPVSKLQMKGSDLSSVILEERESYK